MIVDAEVTIRGTPAAVWAAITDIEHAAATVSGIEAIEIVERPAHGLVGLKWRETRILFGNAATVEKWITSAAEPTQFQTRAESDGFVFITTKRLVDHGGSVTLTESHDSRPQTLMTKLQIIPMGLFFKGVIRKALQQDLQDFKTAVERQATS